MEVMSMRVIFDHPAITVRACIIIGLQDTLICFFEEEEQGRGIYRNWFILESMPTSDEELQLAISNRNIRNLAAVLN